jgi:histidine triad (HIT) family protein
MPQDCLFCQFVAGKAAYDKVWENENFLAFENKFPQAPIHVLVIPKAHISKIEKAEAEDQNHWASLMGAVFEVVRLKKLNKTGYKLVNNGGGYNHLDHEHVHVMGGSKKEPDE